jgi:hypothetical protein
MPRKTNKLTKQIIITIAAIVMVAGCAVYFNRVKITELVFELQKKSLPKAESYNQATQKIGFVNGSVQTIDIIPLQADLKMPEVSSRQPAVSIPAEFNLDVPFMVQAPFGVWDAIHEDACEEASVIMASHFVLKKTITDATYADKEILKIIDWEKNNFGFWVDTDAQRTAEILKTLYGLKNTEVKYDITLADIKAAVASGFPVVLPAAGRELKNPYFRPPGPLYHMVVVKGYTKDGKIIVNDPGTKRGKDFIYGEDLLFNAIHDWNGGDVLNGKKAMIIVKE